MTQYCGHGSCTAKRVLQVIYCRVSTKEQVDNLSLPTQRKACEEYCRREGWEVAQAFIEEGESAKTTDRTELKRMLAFCREHRKTVGIVCVYNLSRFSRNTGDHHALRGVLAGLGIMLKSATEPLDDSPTGKFMETIFSAVAQLDNDVKAERTRAGMKAALQLGRWTWQPPFGYTRGQRGGPSMIPHPEHAPAVRSAFTDFANGVSKPEVLQRLKANGSVGHRCRQHTLKALDRMLRNALYAGRVEMPRWAISRMGDFELLVSEATCYLVQSRLAGRLARRTTHAKDHPDFPLRRVVRCGRCEGQGLTGAWSRGGSGKLFAYYECRRCRLRASKADLEGAFVELLARLQPRPEFVRLFRAVVLDVWKRRETDAREERTRHERQVAVLRAKLDRLADLLTDGTVDAETYQRQRARLRERIAAAEVDLGDAVVEHLDVDAVLAFAEHVLVNAASVWEQASAEHKLPLQSAFFPDGRVGRANSNRRNVICVQGVERALAGPEGHLASPTRFELVLPP